MFDLPTNPSHLRSLKVIIGGHSGDCEGGPPVSRITETLGFCLYLIGGRHIVFGLFYCISRIASFFATLLLQLRLLLILLRLQITAELRVGAFLLAVVVLFFRYHIARVLPSRCLRVEGVDCFFSVVGDHEQSLFVNIAEPSAVPSQTELICEVSHCLRKSFFMCGVSVSKKNVVKFGHTQDNCFPVAKGRSNLVGKGFTFGGPINVIIILAGFNLHFMDSRMLLTFIGALFLCNHILGQRVVINLAIIVASLRVILVRTHLWSKVLSLAYLRPGVGLMSRLGYGVFLWFPICL